MNDSLMVDCETLSLEPNALILSIGAVRFGGENGNVFELLQNPNRTFYVGISVADQEQYGRHVCEDALKWWMEQPDQLRSEAFAGTVSLRDALVEFAEWAGPNRPDMWAKGYKDATWLESAFKACNLPFPFNFRRVFDLRTLQELSGESSLKVRNLKKHHALDDAIYQAVLAQRGLHKISAWRDRCEFNAA